MFCDSRHVVSRVVTDASEETTACPAFLREIKTTDSFEHVNFSVYGGHAVAKLVEALCYNPEYSGFESQFHWIFQLT
jgi:hypothetical protein